MVQLRNSGLASQTGNVYLPAQREPPQLDNAAPVRGLSPELKALQQNPNKLHTLFPRSFQILAAAWQPVHSRLWGPRVSSLPLSCCLWNVSPSFCVLTLSPECWAVTSCTGQESTTLSRWSRRNLLGSKHSTLGTAGSKHHTSLHQPPHIYVLPSSSQPHGYSRGLDVQFGCTRCNAAGADISQELPLEMEGREGKPTCQQLRQNIFCPSTTHRKPGTHPSGNYCFESSLFIATGLPTGSSF